MTRGFAILCCIVLGVVICPYRSPAPLIYRPGEGWTYESVGGAKWQRTRAKDQLEVAQEAFDNHVMAYRIGEDPRVLLPQMVCQDGFFVSHITSDCELPDAVGRLADGHGPR